MSTALSDPIEPVTKSGKLRISGRKLAPFGQRDSAVPFEDIAAVEVDSEEFKWDGLRI